MPSKRPVRIMNISGSPVDRREALQNAVASSEPIDVLVGDWMSEVNMPVRAYSLVTEGENAIGYEPSFLDALEPALEGLAAKKIKLAANAGCVATKALYDQVMQMVEAKGLREKLTVAWIEGDDVTSMLKTIDPMDQFSVCSGQRLSEWPYEPIFAQCYLGGWAIATAFEAGANIVLCGRVADASPIVGAAAWWHGWSRTNYDCLAQALIAGHLIECSTYVTGGDFSGFKSLDWSGIHNLGFPIAEIAADGDVVICKDMQAGGIVSVETCKEQLLYEIQGKYYLNSDVTAIIDNVTFEELMPNRIRLSGITGLAPPSTTKAGLTALGGYKVEMNWALVGLDIEEKRRMYETQLRHRLGQERLAKLSHLSVTTYGSVPENPRSQNAATVDLRLFAQSRDIDAVSAENFAKPAFSIIMQSYPAATYTTRCLGTPTAFQEYFPTIIPQPSQTIHFSTNQTSIEVPPPQEVLSKIPIQPSYETTSPYALDAFGPCVRVPLAKVVFARAGDKGSNCNVGFFPKVEAAWPWLRSFLSTKTFIDLLGDDYQGHRIDRMEFPKIWAVHFLLHDWLDRGVTANATYDVLGKFVAEYVRCKVVDVPEILLRMGTV